MHHRIVTIVAGLGLLAAGTAAAQDATLRQLAESALRTHEAIGRADSQVRRGEAQVRLARSALMPRLELNGATTWYQEEATLDLGDGQGFEIRPSNDYSWSADLRQTLFYGLRDWRARDVARLNRDIARLQRVTTANDLVLEVAATYLRATSDAEGVAVAESTLKQIESQLAVAERRYEVGETSVADVARWRAERAAAYQQVVVARGDAALSLRRLELLCGVEDVAGLVPLKRVPVPETERRELISTAFSTRMELDVLRHQLEAAGLLVKIEQGAWYPELEAHAQYFNQKATFPSKDWTSFALTLKVPIYDGGLTAARSAEAKEDLREVELLDQEIRKAITDQVEAAAIGLDAAEAALAASQDRRDAAREAYRQVERAYRVGEASATDLLSTTAEQTAAETAAIIARAQREYQAIALRHAIGENPLPDLDTMTVVDAPTTEE
jgi:outer membrane protein TolC